MLCWATQDGQVVVESSDKMWSTGRGNGKPFQYSCLESPMMSMKRQKDRTLKDEIHRSVVPDKWRSNSRKNEEMEPKRSNTQLWVWLVMEVKCDAVKSNVAEKPGMLGPWIKANWKWPNRRWQEWILTF